MFRDSEVSSGKCQILLDLLESIVASKEKVLIFTTLKTRLIELLAKMIKKSLSCEPMVFTGTHIFQKSFFKHTIISLTFNIGGCSSNGRALA